MVYKLFFMFLTFFNSSYGSDYIYSKINNKKSKITKDYSFVLLGHIYGSQQAKNSVYPSSSLLANIDLIDDFSNSFVVSLGDMVINPSKDNFSNLKMSLLDKISIPFFNAVGNHDINDTCRNSYEENFGKTFFYFKIHSEIFIFLDTELNQDSTKNDQYKFINKVFKTLDNDHSIKNVFVFTHKLLFAEVVDEFIILKKNVNNRRGYSSQVELANLIFSSLISISKKKNTFWCAGDVGTNRNLPLFYEEDDKTGIKFIATGLGDTNSDAFVKVEVKSGLVNSFPISLTNKKIAFNGYGIKDWNEYFKPKERSIIKKIYTKLNNKAFRLGFICGIIFLFAPIIILIKK